MASQQYDRDRNHFLLDLHGVLKRDAARVIRKRIEECVRYGISSIEVVYGTPDFFDGSIASTLWEIVHDSPDVQTGRLPQEFLNDCEHFSTRTAKVTVPLRVPLTHAPRNEEMVFTPFPASREPDAWLRRQCENPFAPGKPGYSRREAAKFVGRGCRASDIGPEVVSLEELEALCRSWQPPVAEAAPGIVPELVPEPLPKPPVEVRWEEVWSEAAESFAAGELKTSQEQLQRCMELAGESSDGRCLARTLSALSMLFSARLDSANSEAYYHSATAAFEQASADTNTDTTRERVELESRLVEACVAQGRLADAVAMLRDLRERLAGQDGDHPAELLYALTTEASLRAQLDDSESAAVLMQQALGVAEGQSSIAPMVSANIRMHLGFLESRRGLLRKALKHLTQAAEELDVHPQSFVQGFLCRREIAMLAGQLGYGAQAEELLQGLVKVPTVPGSKADLARIAVMLELGNVRLQQRRWAEAVPYYLQAREEIAAAGSPASFRYDIHHNLGCAYAHLGRHVEAEREFASASELVGELYPPLHPSTAQLHRSMGMFYGLAGRHAEARAANERALQIYGGFGGPALPDAAEAHFGQGLMFAGQREWDESEYHLRLALSMKNEIFGEGHPATAMVLMKLGHLLRDRGSLIQARGMLTRAIRIMEDYRMDPALLWEGYSSQAMLRAAGGQEKEARKSHEKAEFYRWQMERNRKSS